MLCGVRYMLYTGWCVLPVVCWLRFDVCVVRCVVCILCYVLCCMTCVVCVVCCSLRFSSVMMRVVLRPVDLCSVYCVGCMLYVCCCVWCVT